MNYLIARHRLSDFATWNTLFRSHAAAQRRAGLHLLHVLRDVDDPAVVVALFEVRDLEKAKAFTGTSGAREAARLAGIVDVELIYVSD